MVPGGGIEPPTRGFSIHCSTPELPGHGRRYLPLRSACSNQRSAACPVAAAINLAVISVKILAAQRGVFVVLLSDHGRFRRDGVAPVQPASEIHVGATFAAKRAVARIGFFFANRTAHDRHSFSGRRSRFLCSSIWPSGVQPTRLVSIGSALSAARSACSTCRRCPLGIGAISTVI